MLSITSTKTRCGVTVAKSSRGWTLVAILYALNLAGFYVASALTSLLHIHHSLPSYAVRALTLGLSLILLGVVIRYRLPVYRGRFLYITIGFWLLYMIVMIRDLFIVSIYTPYPTSYYLAHAIGSCFVPMLAFIVFLDARAIERAYTYTLLATALSCILLLVIAVTSREMMASNLGYDAGRLATDVVNPISFGRNGATLCVLALHGLIVYPSMKRWHRIALSAFVVIGVCIVALSGSRMPIIVLAITFAVLLSMAARHRFPLWKVASLVLGSVAMISLIWFVSAKYETRGITRLQNTLEQSHGSALTLVDARTPLYERAWNQFLHSPATGNAFVETESGYWPHNIVLESFMATGIAGGVLFIALLCFSVMAAIRLLSHAPNLSWIALLYILHMTSKLVGGPLYASNYFWILSMAVVATAYSPFIQVKVQNVRSRRHGVRTPIMR